MIRINEPIRVVCKGDDQYELIITRESKKIEANEEVFNFIQYLREKRLFDKSVIDDYVKAGDILNKESYDELFEDLLQNNIITNNDNN